MKATSTTSAPQKPITRRSGKAINDPTAPPRCFTSSRDAARDTAPVIRWNRAREATKETPKPVARRPCS